MTATMETAITSDNLEKTIARAMQKMGTSKENDLCLYLSDGEGRLHHFTMQKMKSSEPKALAALIEDKILNAGTPKVVPAKPRKKRSGKNEVKLSLRQDQIVELLSALKGTNNDELIEALSSTRSIKKVQKLMIQMVREKKVDSALWDTYCKMVK